MIVIISSSTNEETILHDFFRNSEAPASEYPEYLEELFLHYYIQSDMFNRVKSTITHQYAIGHNVANSL